MTLWQNMTSEEKYRVVKMARRGEMQIKEICEAFGVTRQTLNKAIEKVEEAALTALESKPSGRKPKTEEAQKITELSKSHASLEKEVDHWKTRYEVAQKYISIMHEEDEVEERRERNRRKRERKQQKTSPSEGHRPIPIGCFPSSAATLPRRQSSSPSGETA